MRSSAQTGTAQAESVDSVRPGLPTTPIRAIRGRFPLGIRRPQGRSRRDSRSTSASSWTANSNSRCRRRRRSSPMRVDEKAKFLGYEITVTRDELHLSPDGKRSTQRGHRLADATFGRTRRSRTGYSRKGKVIHRTELIDDDDYTIISAVPVGPAGALQLLLHGGQRLHATDEPRSNGSCGNP